MSWLPELPSKVFAYRQVIERQFATDGCDAEERLWATPPSRAIPNDTDKLKHYPLFTTEQMHEYANQAITASHYPIETTAARLTRTERLALSSLLVVSRADAGDIDKEPWQLTCGSDSYWSYYTYHALKKILEAETPEQAAHRSRNSESLELDAMRLYATELEQVGLPNAARFLLVECNKGGNAESAAVRAIATALRKHSGELDALREFYSAWSDYNATDAAEKRLGDAIAAIAKATQP